LFKHFLSIIAATVLVAGCSSSSDLTLNTGQPAEPVNPGQILPQVVTELTALHRSGQTFLVWPENGATRFHVYRHSTPITEGNLASATRLTGRWGALGSNTSRNTYGSAQEPANFVVEDFGTPLSDTNGLFVHTVQSGQAGNTYYAITTVSGTVETLDTRNTLSTPVSESVATPRPILVSSRNGGNGRLYTHYMDYQNWNPTLNGYAFSYTVARPANYNPSRSYPLQLNLHAYGEGMRYLNQSEFEDWEIIQLFPHDPGEAQGTIHTWWYGHATDHNFQTLPGSSPTSGTVTNFTEQRIMQAVREVISDSAFNINTELVHTIGNSMGASGALALGLRYPNVLSGIYASQPMTNYSTSPTFKTEFDQLWGRTATNLQIVNRGADSGVIQRYGAGGNSPTGVWNWMNHLQQLTQRSADGFAFLAIDHGKADTVIDWQTQGKPLVAALTNARAGFSANALGGVGHSWQAFGAVVKPVFGLGFGDEAPWRYPLSLSFPSITNATGSGAINPADTGNDAYNTNIEWSTQSNNFDQPISESGSAYEISLRTTAAAQTANVTPRRTSAFRPGAGTQCQWTASSNATGQTLGSGNATAGNGGAVTATGVPITATPGTRLRITC
jgi:hypothetical protein